MKIKSLLIASVLCLSALSAKAQDESNFKFYGFIRNFYAFDTRESVAGTSDFFYWVPKDENIVNGVDLNQNNNYRFSALTSRVGVDVSGYQYGEMKVGAKIEADFYSGLSGSTGTATMRLRQAYMTLAWEDPTSIERVDLKLGQAWHPMAVDMPDVFSLNAGAPFGPFSRTPLVQADYKFSEHWSMTSALLWQMQYTSAGPNGVNVGAQANSANFIRNGGAEFFLGFTYTNKNFLAKMGLNELFITPRTYNEAGEKVKERLNSDIYFLYLQYKKDLFTAKFKTVFAESGEHVSLNGGYAITGMDTNKNYIYTPMTNWSSWASLSYGKDWKFVLFGGYAKNLGLPDDVKVLRKPNSASPVGVYFSKNSFDNFNQMWRVTPTVMRNFGKITIGLEYEITSVQYGDKESSFNVNLIGDNGLYTKGLHWVTNNRIQMIARYTF